LHRQNIEIKKSLNMLTKCKVFIALTSRYSSSHMKKANGWVITRRAQEALGLDRSTLFKYRDDGTLKLGPHYAAFPETRSRNSFRWNINKIRKHLQEQGISVAASA
jgi:hypothetical protein